MIADTAFTPDSIIMRSATHGANRNRKGGKSISFPLRLRLTSEGKPHIETAADGSTLVLPDGYGMIAYNERDLIIESIECEQKFARLDGDNFCVIVAPLGVTMTIRGSYFVKNGKWSHTELIDERFQFVKEWREDKVVPAQSRWNFAKPLPCPPRQAETVEELEI